MPNLQEDWVCLIGCDLARLEMDRSVPKGKLTAGQLRRYIYCSLAGASGIAKPNPYVVFPEYVQDAVHVAVPFPSSMILPNSFRSEYEMENLPISQQNINRMIRCLSESPEYFPRI